MRYAPSGRRVPPVAVGVAVALLISGCASAAPGPSPASAAVTAEQPTGSSPGGCVPDPVTYTAHASTRPAVGPVPTGTADLLDHAVVQAIASTQQPGAPAPTSAPGVIAAVSGPTGTWVKAYGVADTATGAPMTTQMHHRIGSVTKTFTATLVLQLASEGKLSLADQVSAYVPGVPRGDQITIDQLLAMRTGIADYFDAFLPTWIAHSSVAYTADQMLAVGYAHPPLFAPGAGFDYSNSNYLLLGKIVEKVTGDSLSHVLTTRILAPMRLTGTSWPGESAALPDPHDRGYTSVTAADGALAGTPDGSLVDATAYNPAWSGAAGEMTSTVQDLLTYGRALGTGAGLLPAAAQSARLSSFRPAFTPTSQYGQGMACRSGWVGHSGDTLGYHTDLYYDGTIDTTIAVMMNRYPSYQPQNIVSALAASLDRPIAALE